jgi:hypothetical protein
MVRVLEELKMTAKTTVRQLNADLMFKQQMSLQYLLEVPPAKPQNIWEVAYIWGKFDQALCLEPFRRKAIGWSKEHNERRQWHDDRFRILPATVGPEPSRGERHDPAVIEGAPPWLAGTRLEKELIVQRQNWAAFAPRLFELAEKRRKRDVAAVLEVEHSIEELGEAAREVPWQQAIDDLPVMEYLEGSGLLSRAQFFLVPDLIDGLIDRHKPPRDMFARD